MKNGDLYKLGCTSNLESEASKMKPGKIISSFKTKDPKSFEVRLLRLYKNRRIPDTNYFRLSESEVNSCKKHLVPCIVHDLDIYMKKSNMKTYYNLNEHIKFYIAVNELSSKTHTFCNLRSGNR